MAFKTTLSMDSKEYRVLSFGMSFSRGYDDIVGQVTSGLRGVGKLTMRVESTKDVFLFDSIGRNKVISQGEIKFYKLDEESPMKQLQFEKGIVIAFAENMDATSNTPMTIDFSIAVQKLTFSGGPNSATIMAWGEHDH